MIDQARILELESEIGAEDLVMILAAYFEEARAMIRRIEHGLRPEEIVRALHFLRSGALNLGLVGLAEIAERMREIGPVADGAALTDILEETRVALAPRMPAARSLRSPARPEAGRP
ncbi:Hpt domain-containing protein [uncultured Jannaschia sp.]|uniref:Hpt domain-containing protein n=1 Tax=uncultured Jannaschia sp. TaxID=293347 RepID=UPI00263784F1|nr:Hpt domain-containing protein [uncultured Jannaschia sp.]